MQAKARLCAGRGAAPARITPRAPGAETARRPPAEHDTVSGHHAVDAGPNLLHGPSAFVSEQGGQGMRPPGLGDMEIGVADAARLQPDEDFVRPRRLDLDLHEAKPPHLCHYDAAIHVESRSLAFSAPMSASVTSVSSASWRSTTSTVVFPAPFGPINPAI